MESKERITMNKFDLYERLWQEISEESIFLPDREYTEKEYKKLKKLIQINLFEAVLMFSEHTDYKQRIM